MRIAIIGRSEILYETTLQLRSAGHEIVCILTAKESPEYVRTLDDYRALAMLWNIPFAQGPKISEHLEFLHAASADVGISINYTGIIPQSVIDIFPLGILNAHGGDLPRYRGNACQAWAILNGESLIGLCIHKMIGGELDNGDIIERDYLPIDDCTTVTAVWDWMTQRTPHLIIKAVGHLLENPGYFLELQSKDPLNASRCYPRVPDDGLIDWNMSALDILRLINATNKPYSGAYCYFEGKKLIIWDAKLVEDSENFFAVSGQITLVGDGFVHVACNIGKIMLLVVEYCGLVVTPDTLMHSIRKRLT